MLFHSLDFKFYTESTGNFRAKAKLLQTCTIPYVISSDAAEMITGLYGNLNHVTLAFSRPMVAQQQFFECMIGTYFLF